MDHDHELLFEQIVRPKRVDQRGPIAEFLAKKDAEQERQTARGSSPSGVRSLPYPSHRLTLTERSDCHRIWAATNPAVALR